MTGRNSCHQVQDGGNACPRNPGYCPRCLELRQLRHRESWKKLEKACEHFWKLADRTVLKGILNEASGDVGPLLVPPLAVCVGSWGKDSISLSFGSTEQGDNFKPSSSPIDNR